MAGRSLDQATTILDVAERLNTLGDRDKYVREVFGNLFRWCRDTDESVQVRLGISGSGRSPHYRIEPEGTAWNSGLMYDDTIVGEFVRLANTSRGLPNRPPTKCNPGEVHGVFDGRTHKPYQRKNEHEIEAMLRVQNWSRQATPFDEVKELLGRIRNFKPKRN